MNKEEINKLQKELDKAINKKETLKGGLGDVYRKSYYDLKYRIDKAIEYLEELISDTKGMIDNYNNEDKKQTIKRFIEDLKTDLEHYKYLQLLLRGEDNER